MLTNAVVVSVVVLCALCLIRVNVLLALLFSAVTAGIVGGLGLDKTMEIFITGMGSNPETALSYVLLGTLAAAISYTGLADILAVKIAKTVGKPLPVLPESLYNAPQTQSTARPQRHGSKERIYAIGL